MSFYGKHFGSMYEGSMVGKGAIVFALMGYVIAKMDCRWVGEGRAKVVTEGTVRLNVEILETIFGEPSSEIQKGIDLLCAPDPKTNRPDEDGRRLVKIGTFDYRVVNAAHYQNLKNKEEQLEKNKIRMAEYRERKKEVILTGKDAEDFEAAKTKHYTRRRKVIGNAAACAGGTQALKDGIAEKNGSEDEGHVFE
jgi:hypothetical protein